LEQVFLHVFFTVFRRSDALRFAEQTALNSETGRKHTCTTRIFFCIKTRTDTSAIIY